MIVIAFVLVAVRFFARWSIPDSSVVLSEDVVIDPEWPFSSKGKLTHSLPKESHVEEAQEETPQRSRHDVQRFTHGVELFRIVIG